MSLSISHLDEFLGEGAFSWVYSLKNGPYAAKIGKFDGEELDWEFSMLSSLAKINSPLFPQVLATGTFEVSDGQPQIRSTRKFLLMERLGVSLEELLHLRGQLAVPTIVQIGRQLISQLSLLIASGITHNDIKPANILFGLTDRRKQVFLVDYGFAKTSKCPKSELFRGNLAFAASKKLRGNYQHDLRNDLQSIIYVLLWALRDGSLSWQEEEVSQNSIERRAVQILTARQQFIEKTLKSEAKPCDKRSILILELVRLVSRAEEGTIAAGELLCQLQAVL